MPQTERIVETDTGEKGPNGERIIIREKQSYLNVCDLIDGRYGQQYWRTLFDDLGAEIREKQRQIDKLQYEIRNTEMIRGLARHIAEDQAPRGAMPAY